jgi:chromosome segregation protein
VFLKSLTLKGFKSFADPVTLHLEPGVTVVVGPNGSGKSNVVDAIAWVLGAQGPRALRGSKMEDVIFAGSADRPALGRAEVTLTIDNRAGRLPGGLAEITITRTLFRSGDSEYALNGQPCRLLDIQELLSDSGVGRTQHVIVGQGQLDQILNARPEDRRAVIEEAAGVLKHRRRRERSERRLAAAEENLERLGDLLRELRRQIRPLERQATAARSHGRIADELRTLRLHLAGRELVSLTDRLQVAADSRDRLRDEATELKQQLNDIDAAVERSTAELSSRDDEDLIMGLGRTQGLAERCLGLSGVLAERGRSLERALMAAADVDVVSSLEADAARLAEQLEQAEAEAIEFTPEIALLDAEEADLAQEANAIEALGDESEARAARQSQATAGARLEAGLKALELDGEHLGQLREHREATQRRLEALEHQSEALKGELEAILSQVAELETQRSRSDQVMRESERLLKAAEDTAEAAGREHDRADARAESLAGAQQVLQGTAGRQALSGAAGVHGALADLVDVDEGFEVAFAAAVSGALESVVVDGSHAADAVALLRSLSVSGTLLPAVADSANAFSSGAEGSLGFVGAEGSVGSHGAETFGAHQPMLPRGAEALRSHVHTTVPEVQVLLDRLLAGTAVVLGGWELALEMALDRPELTFLTQEGDRFSRDGWTVGLAARGLTAAVVDQARDAALAAARSAGAAVAQVESAREHVDIAARTLADSQSALSQTIERRRSVERSMEQVTAVARAIEQEMSEADPERAGLEARMIVAEEQLSELRRELAELTEKAENATSRALQAERARIAHTARKAELQNRRSQIQVRAGALAERREVLSTRLDDVEKRLSGHAEERRLAEERRHRIVADTVAVERLQTVVESHQLRVESVAAQLQELRDRQVELLRAGGARLEDLRRQRVATDARLTAVRDRHQAFDVELAEVGARHQAATEALERELECRPEEAIAALCPELPEGKSPEQRAAELQAELQKMGPINPLAAEELSALEERNEFLEREVDDVRRARRELQQVIRSVDDEIARLFAEAFEDVDRHFQVLVSAMFPGGAGRLSLTEPTDALGTGVELEARPAGKQVRKLSLLSGGERSLVALAFLFAVFRSRPSPFYVMDEVEAALDDVNLHRFLGLLHEFRDEAQLIVVSHQKRTMESADALYGVTMTPGGSSKVVSQKVNGHKAAGAMNAVDLETAGQPVS